MFEQLEDREKYGLAGAAVVVLAVGFAAGTFMTGGSLTGMVSSPADSGEVEQAVQDMMDQQLQAQEQQFQQLAAQDPNLSAEDMSMDASVDSVERSEFGSLYRVTVTVSGTVPSQVGGQLQDIEEQQTYYVSEDARYLFQEPIDLEGQQSLQ